MKNKQILLKRKFILENLDLYISEAAYHKKHDDDESYGKFDIWSWGTDTGEGKLK